MGLTVYYDWKVKADLPAARRLVKKFRTLALRLPFDSVSEVVEQGPSDDHSYRQGTLFLGRKRADGAEETVHVPPLHALFFTVRVRGAESAPVGLASHPPVVVHREDVIERRKDGSESGRRIGAGDAIEYPTRRRGYFSWQSFCKTQYAGHPKLGGETNFLKAHLTLIELLDQIKAAGAAVSVRDDSKYARHRDVDRLLRSVREWDALVAGIVGRLGDALGGSGELIAPIKERPDFEHLEAKGIAVLRRLAARQRRRKKGPP